MAGEQHSVPRTPRPAPRRRGRDTLLAFQQDLESRIDGTLPPAHVAQLLAGHLIDSDDEQCRDDLGLIVAADRIQRADVVILLGIDPPETSCWHSAPALRCPDCIGKLAWGRIHAALNS